MILALSIGLMDDWFVLIPPVFLAVLQRMPQ